MTIADKDRALLALLSENARMPVAELARKLGLSRTTVQARIERLEAEGVIAGYGLRLSESYLSGLVRAHVLITIGPKALPGVTAALTAIKEVTTLHSVSGTFDLIAILAAPSILDLDRLIDRIGALDGVERTLSSIILSTRISRLVLEGLAGKRWTSARNALVSLIPLTSTEIRKVGACLTLTHPSRHKPSAPPAPRPYCPPPSGPMPQPCRSACARAASGTIRP
jgi:DNA-binding Lrp family transcriptional regulator